MSVGLAAFTLVHVATSLIGIFSGFVVVFGMLGAKRMDGWTALFLTTTVLTSVTGFLFPFHKFLPSHGVGIISLILLTIAIYARYPRDLAGGWRSAYVSTAVCTATIIVPSPNPSSAWHPVATAPPVPSAHSPSSATAINPAGETSANTGRRAYSTPPAASPAVDAVPLASSTSATSWRPMPLILVR